MLFVHMLTLSLCWIEFLPGHASISLDPRSRFPAGQHILSISPGHGLAPNATITAEVNNKMCHTSVKFWKTVSKPLT